MWITGAEKNAAQLSTGDAQVTARSYTVSQSASWLSTGCILKKKISYPQDFGWLIITS
jgi:hypothetical protein